MRKEIHSTHLLDLKDTHNMFGFFYKKTPHGPFKGPVCNMFSGSFSKSVLPVHQLVLFHEYLPPPSIPSIPFGLKFYICIRMNWGRRSIFMRHLEIR